MILCLAQLSPVWNDPAAGLLKVRAYAAEAVEGDASFLALPEQILTGWDPCNSSGAEDENGPLVAALSDIARDYSIGILGSYREKGVEKPRNTCIAIGPDGSVLSRYAKVHLFSPGKEDEAFEPGDSLGIFSINSCRVGIAICYDLRFSNVFRLYREAGVHLVIVPSAWPSSRLKHLHLFTTSRAAEFQMYVASVNTVGTTPVDTYNGGSCIAGPDGRVSAMGSDQEELIFCEIDSFAVEETRKRFPVFSDEKKIDYSRFKS